MPTPTLKLLYQVPFWVVVAGAICALDILWCIWDWMVGREESSL